MNSLTQQLKAILLALTGKKPPKPRDPRGFAPTDIVVGQSIHRTPPRWRRQRTAGGKMAKVLMPASTKTVPVYGMAWFPTGKDYRGRLGHKDKMRRALATGVE